MKAHKDRKDSGHCVKIMAPKSEYAFDVLLATADSLQISLTKGELTSVQIVETCLQHIKAHNQTGANIRAVISSPPENQLVQTAKALDEERAKGKVRGPLHGIPVIIKAKLELR